MKTNKKLIGLFILMLALIAVSLSSCVHEHSFNSWITSNEATCTSTGTEFRSCSSCEYTETRSIPAKGHNEVKISAVSPTCTKGGNTEGSKCSYCGIVFTEAKTIPAKGHNEDANGTCKTCGTNTMLQDIKENLDVKLIVSKPRSDKNVSVKLYISNATKYTITISKGNYDHLHSAHVNGTILTTSGDKKLEPNYYTTITYVSYWLEPKASDYFYCDNDSIGFVTLTIGEKNIYIKFDVNGLLDAGFTRESIGWY